VSEEQETRQRQAAAAARAHEREEVRPAREQQRRAFHEQRAAAAAGHARQSGDGAWDGVSVVVSGQRPRRQRPAWVDVEPVAASDAAERSAGGDPPDAKQEQRQGRRQQVDAELPGATTSSSAAADLTAEQRRSVWEEMRQAALRNQEQAEAQERGSIAAFLGVPADAAEGVDDGVPARLLAAAVHPVHVEALERNDGAGGGQSNRQHAPGKQQRVNFAEAAPARVDTGQSGSRESPLHARSPAAAPPSQAGEGEDGDPWERRRRRLEEDRARREAEIKAFQRQHWAEMKAASARNRAAVIGEVLGGTDGDAPGQVVESEAAGAAAARAAAEEAPAAAATDGSGNAAASAGGAVENDGVDEYSAMIADIQGIVMQPTAAAAAAADDDEDASTTSAAEAPQLRTAGRRRVRVSFLSSGGGGGGRPGSSGSSGGDGVCSSRALVSVSFAAVLLDDICTACNQG